MFEQLQKSIDIFLIQELWLFDYELTLLAELHAECLEIGKAVTPMIRYLLHICHVDVEGWQYCRKVHSTNMSNQ